VRELGGVQISILTAEARRKSRNNQMRKKIKREKTQMQQVRKTPGAIALGTIPYDNYARYDVEFAMQNVTASIAHLSPTC
jgi:hypothetical protein